VTEKSNEDRGDLRSCVVGQTKGREQIASQTAALMAFAGEQQFEVPREWIFEDDGYSGASLIRPGLERVRDLAAEG
jgi:site-specific DNA recombinase